MDASGGCAAVCAAGGNVTDGYGGAAAPRDACGVVATASGSGVVAADGVAGIGDVFGVTAGGGENVPTACGVAVSAGSAVAAIGGGGGGGCVVDAASKGCDGGGVAAIALGGAIATFGDVAAGFAVTVAVCEEVAVPDAYGTVAVEDVPAVCGGANAVGGVAAAVSSCSSSGDGSRGTVAVALPAAPRVHLGLSTQPGEEGFLKGGG